jgi:RNA polymerase sigma-70 factor (ECF subfamily)
MSSASGDRPLEHISTLWSVVCRAQDGQPQEAAEAQRVLLLRYAPAARRYLLGALRDPEAADDLFQEFSLRVLRGDLRNAAPERGRFRSFVKGVLYHLIADHHRRRARDRQLPEEAPEPAAPIESTAEVDRELLRGWREQLLDGAWQALEQIQRQTGQAYHAVLRLRADQPDLSSGGMAEELSRRLGKPVSSAWVRQNLHRAREKFVDLVLEEVRQTLEEPSIEELENELIDLELYEYCRAALDRWRAAR